MHILAMLLSFLLAVLGLEPGPRALTLSASTEGAARGLASSVATPGSLRVDCLHSASGRCHYLLYVDECASVSEQESPLAGGQTCTRRELRRFELGSGRSLTLALTMPGTRHCVDPARAPTLDTCSAG